MTATAVPAGYGVRARNLAPDSDNRIHADDVAQQFGFTGALVPGVDVFAYVSHPFVAAFGAAFLAGGRLQVRFRRPVYDGDVVDVSVHDTGAGSYDVGVAGPDGQSRCVGTGWAPGAPGATAPVPELRRTAPGDPLPTGPEPLPLGPLGSVDEPVDRQRHDVYLDGIDEDLPAYRVDGLAHPGALLRLANELLMRNVALGPWIHTASDCRFLAPAPLPALLHADGAVTEVFERNGHHYVRYDAVVTADDVPVLAVAHEAIYRLAAAPEPVST